MLFFTTFDNSLAKIVLCLVLGEPVRYNNVFIILWGFRSNVGLDFWCHVTSFLVFWGLLIFNDRDNYVVTFDILFSVADLMLSFTLLDWKQLVKVYRNHCFITITTSLVQLICWKSCLFMDARGYINLFSNTMEQILSYS